jgi:anti-sigma B factor antagonist
VRAAVGMLDNRITLITISGELDLPAERRLRPDLTEAVGDRSREIVVDLRDVTFIDSCGLALLVHAHQQLQRQGRALACVAQEGPVPRMLEAAGLSDILRLFGSVDEAAAHLLASAPQPAAPRGAWIRDGGRSSPAG